MSNLTIHTLANHQIAQNIEDIARLRIDIFREYPYLYDGDFKYEANYLSKFAHVSNSVLIVLKDNEHIVGSITGLPLQYEDSDIQAPWIDKGLAIKHVYYFSEILIYPKYRGKGIGQQLFAQAEATVTALNQYHCFSLATIIRPKHHPSSPYNYKNVEDFWTKNGYQKQEHLICHITWKEIGETNESPKPLVFWTKHQK